MRCPEAEVFGDARRQKLDEDMCRVGVRVCKRQEEGNEDCKEKESGGKVANVRTEGCARG